MVSSSVNSCTLYEVMANIKKDISNDISTVESDRDKMKKEEYSFTRQKEIPPIEVIILQPDMDETTLSVDENCGNSLLHPKTSPENDPLKIPYTNKHTVTKYQCGLCAEKFNSNNLKTHYKICRRTKQISGKGPLSKEIIIKMHECMVCGMLLKTFRGWKAHLKTHSDEEIFKSNERQKRFRLAISVPIQQDRQFQCDVCRKCFVLREDMVTHRKSHTEAEPYKCDLCEKRFSQFIYLAMHKWSHSTIDRPYKCDLCPVTFSEEIALVWHKRIHSGERPYECNICLMKFALMDTLIMHKQVHATDPKLPYECVHCGEKFSGKGRLQLHQQMHETG